MKRELTTAKKRVIIGWLQSGYYDINELAKVDGEPTTDTTDPEAMSLKEIEDEIVRLSRFDTPEFIARIIEANGMCRDCNKLKKYLYGEESKNII